MRSGRWHVEERPYSRVHQQQDDESTTPHGTARDGRNVCSTSKEERNFNRRDVGPSRGAALKARKLRKLSSLISRPRDV